MPPKAPRRRPFRPHFTYLYRLVLTRSRAAECRKANHFLAHLALLVGPEALSRPATTQNSLGGGGGGPPPPPPPPPRPPAPHGWATPSRKAPPSAEDIGLPQSKTHRTQKIREKLHVVIPCVLEWADFSVVGFPKKMRSRHSAEWHCLAILVLGFEIVPSGDGARRYTRHEIDPTKHTPHFSAGRRLQYSRPATNFIRLAARLTARLAPL
jgi:hypothetical protein